MATGDNFVTARDAAGSAYATAIGAIRAAYVELFGYDVAVRNNNLALANTVDTRGFAGALTALPHVLLHPVYAPSVSGVWLDAAKTRADQIIASYPVTSAATIAAARDTAGAAYFTVINAIRAAYIEVAAYDKVVANKRITMTSVPDLRTFGEGAAALPGSLVHPVYANSISPRWLEAIQPRADQILATYTGTERKAEQANLNGAPGDPSRYPAPVRYFWYTPIGESPRFGQPGGPQGPGPTGPGVPLYVES